MKMNCRHFRIMKGKTNFSVAQRARSVSIRGGCYHLSTVSVNSEKNHKDNEINEIDEIKEASL